MGAALDRLAPLLVTLAGARASGDANRIRDARLAVYRLKAKELADVAPPQLTRGEWTVMFRVGPRVTTVKGVPLLDMMVVLRRNGVRVPIDQHLRFVNPPLLVPDGRVDRDGNATYEENPAVSLQTIVFETLAKQVAELRA